MTDRVPYDHYPHEWRADLDEYGLCTPEPLNCRCGEKAIPGGVHCADCLIAFYAPSWRRFPASPVTQKGADE